MLDKQQQHSLLLSLFALGFVKVVLAAIVSKITNMPVGIIFAIVAPLLFPVSLWLVSRYGEDVAVKICRDVAKHRDE